MNININAETQIHSSGPPSPSSNVKVTSQNTNHLWSKFCGLPTSHKIATLAVTIFAVLIPISGLFIVGSVFKDLVNHYDSKKPNLPSTNKTEKQGQETLEFEKDELEISHKETIKTDEKSSKKISLVKKEIPQKENIKEVVSEKVHIKELGREYSVKTDKKGTHVLLTDGKTKVTIPPKTENLAKAIMEEEIFHKITDSATKTKKGYTLPGNDKLYSETQLKNLAKQTWETFNTSKAGLHTLQDKTGAFFVKARLKNGDFKVSIYQQTKVLGQGNFGKAALYQNISAKYLTAPKVKVIKESLTDKGNPDIKNEKRILFGLRDGNFNSERTYEKSKTEGKLVGIQDPPFEVFEVNMSNQTKMGILTPKYDGDLTKFMIDNSVNKRNSEQKNQEIIKNKLDIFNQLATGLADLHEKEVIHGDIKLDNIFLRKNNDGKQEAGIADFGGARHIGDLAIRNEKGLSNRPACSNLLSNMDDEIKNLEKETNLNANDLFNVWKKVDIQALGHAIILSMQTPKLMMKGDDAKGQYQKNIVLDNNLLEKQGNEMEKTYGKDLVDLAREMIDPKTTLTAKEVSERLKYIAAKMA